MFVTAAWEGQEGARRGRQGGRVKMISMKSAFSVITWGDLECTCHLSVLAGTLGKGVTLSLACALNPWAGAPPVSQGFLLRAVSTGSRC